MYRHLLLATDGSELAQKAVAQGLGLAKALQARVTAVTVIEPVPAMVSGDASFVVPLQEFDRAATAHATRILDALTAAAKTAGVTCEVIVEKQLAAATARRLSRSPRDIARMIDGFGRTLGRPWRADEKAAAAAAWLALM